MNNLFDNINLGDILDDEYLKESHFITFNKVYKMVNVDFEQMNKDDMFELDQNIPMKIVKNDEQKDNKYTYYG